MTSKYVSCVFSVLFLLGRRATLVVMIAGWNVHDGSGSSGLGDLKRQLDQGQEMPAPRLYRSD